MSEKQFKSEAQKDEELAAFADRILSDQSVEEGGMNQEPDALETTLFRLKGVVKDPPAEAMKERIEKALVREWKKDMVLEEKKEPGWQRFLPGSRPQKSQGRPVWGLTAAFVVLAIILISLLPASSLITSNMQATAGGSDQNQILLFGLAVLVVIGLLFVGRKRQ